MEKAQARTSLNNYVYVIDCDFHLVYLSPETKQAFPKARSGKFCYEALRNDSTICEDCPWAYSNLQGEGSVRSVIYNTNLRQWLEISCISIEWPGEGLCTAVAAKGIDETNKDSFTQFTQQTIYDELLEVNLNSNTFKFLYAETDKYELPSFSDSLDRIVDIADYLICPEDRKSFIRFWSPATIRRSFEKLEEGGEVRGEFRQKLKSGGYHWTSQTLTPVHRTNGEDDNDIYMCYILDIEEQKARSAREIDIREKRYKALRDRDPLTGLYRTEAFFDKSSELLARHRDESFELLCIDMKNFRLFNEWYGRDAGDQLLKAIARRLKDVKRAMPAIAGYFGADNFAIVMPQGTDLEESLVDRIEMPSLDLKDNIGFFPVMGICTIDDDTPLQTVHDRATIAKNLTKHNYRTRIAWYEENAARQIDDDVKLLLDIQRALANREFVLYWQPQCDIRNGRVVGAEALVRWRHPQRGLVSPGEFIPLLEKSGFIVNLDLYVWEEVCRQLRAWMDAGIEPVPVSVNISQADMYAIDVPATMEDLIEKYRIDRPLLKLEITESTFAESEDIARMATRFKEGGLTVLMDDFGSGYSSLNALKDLDVDILKIDMDFLDWSEENAARGESIVESVMHMTHLMELRVIAEGVETKEQVDFLLDIGCNYAQGFYFYRPLPTFEIQELLQAANKVDHGGVQREPVKLLDLEDLVSNRVTNKSVLDIILGGIAVYSVHDDCYELIEMNRQYRRLTGDDRESVKAHIRDVFSFIHPDDAVRFKEMFEEAERHTITGSQDVIRRYKANGELMWILIKLFYMGREGDARLFYGSLTDISDWKRQQEELALSKGALRDSNTALYNMLGVFDTGKSLDDVTGKDKNFTISYFAQNAPSGFVCCSCAPGCPILFANENLLDMLGYASLDELKAATGDRLENAIHPDDLADVKEALGVDRPEGYTYLAQYRFLHRDGSEVCVADQGRIFRTDGGELAVAAAILDIGDSIKAQAKLELDERLLRGIVRLAKLDAWTYDIDEDRMTFLNIVHGGLIERFLVVDDQDVSEGALVVENFTDAVRATHRFRQDEKRDIFKLIYEVTKGSSVEEVIRVIDRDAHEHWLTIGSKTVCSADGAPQQAIGFLKDAPSAALTESRRIRREREPRRGWTQPAVRSKQP